MKTSSNITDYLISNYIKYISVLNTQLKARDGQNTLKN